MKNSLWNDVFKKFFKWCLPPSPHFISRSCFEFLLLSRTWLDKCVLNEGVKEDSKKTKWILKQNSRANTFPSPKSIAPPRALRAVEGRVPQVPGSKHPSTIPRAWDRACSCVYLAGCTASHATSALFTEGRLASCRKVHSNKGYRQHVPKGLPFSPWYYWSGNYLPVLNQLSIFKEVRMAWVWWEIIKRKRQRTVIKLLPSVCPISILAQFQFLGKLRESRVADTVKMWRVLLSFRVWQICHHIFKGEGETW